MEAYCVRCKAKTQMKDAKEEKTKKGMPITKGKCSACDAKVCCMGKMKSE